VPHPHTGLSRLEVSGPFPFVLSLFPLGMLSREDDALMIPVIGTGLRVVEEGIIPSMVVQDDAPPGLELVAALVQESTIFALVSVQETGCAAPVTGGPFSSFWSGWVFVGLSQVGEGHAWSFRALYEVQDNTRRCFCGSEAFVNLCLSGVCSMFLLYEVPLFKVNRSFPCFEVFLPLFQVSKLPLQLY
jgi:hypothetical protein